jgi:hypothetical protein
MEIRSDKYISNISWLHPFACVSNIGLRFIRWLTWFITVTEEEWWQAGIHLGSERRGDE